MGWRPETAGSAPGRLSAQREAPDGGAAGPRRRGRTRGGAPAQARDGAYGGPRSHVGQPGGTGYAPLDYNLLREPLFAPHGGLHPGLAHVARPVHTGRLGHYGPSQYLDRQMLEEYSHKMQMLQHDFDVMLRPKLDSLRRQIVTVEERIREVSLMKDELLEEALLDHRALVEQITLSSDRRLGALTLDLEQLMRDVALIHDLIQQLAPAPVWEEEPSPKPSRTTKPLNHLTSMPSSKQAPPAKPDSPLATPALPLTEEEELAAKKVAWQRRALELDDDEEPAQRPSSMSRPPSSKPPPVPLRPLAPPPPQAPAERGTDYTLCQRLPSLAH